MNTKSSSSSPLKLPCRLIEASEYWEIQMYRILSRERQRERDAKRQELTRAIEQHEKEADQSLVIIDECTLVEQVELAHMTCTRLKDAEKQLAAANTKIAELERRLESKTIICPICRDSTDEIKSRILPADVDNSIRTMPCGHLICSLCLNQLLHQATGCHALTCPVCKRRVTDDVYELFFL